MLQLATSSVRVFDELGTYGLVHVIGRAPAPLPDNRRAASVPTARGWRARDDS
jgi:hypothetical protein